MPRAQANWNLTDLVLPEGDPMQEIAQLKSAAKVIDLERGVPEIYAEFRGLVDKEARLANNAGVTCDLKWTADGGRSNPCDTCPHYKAIHTGDALAVLCALGRGQNALIAEMDALNAVDRLDDALMAAYEADSAYVDAAVAAL